ncbi:hypothetical protein RB195_005768 [Necator americanus]|uniref:Uncharacterized protein n=1 Tax=Necator americanus TaxID=51031 RepID=A0ABR1BPL1_NECAM
MHSPKTASLVIHCVLICLKERKLMTSTNDHSLFKQSGNCTDTDKFRCSFATLTKLCPNTVKNEKERNIGECMWKTYPSPSKRMAAVRKWSAAFKEIHGESPKKSDYGLAPSHVREEYFAQFPPSPVKEPITHRKGGVRLKRPLEDESPLKQRPSKARRLCIDQNVRGVGTNPGKNLLKQSPFIFSPVKVSFTLPGALRTRRAIKALEEINATSIPSSFLPNNSQEMRSPTKRVTGFCGFSSLFDTPEKGQPTSWGDISPQKVIAPPTTLGIPMRSPRKPIVHKEILVKNVECLLLPTPEKRNREEELKPFEPEDIPSKKKTFIGLSKNEVAAAFDPKTGKILKRAFKRSAPVATQKKKKVEGNFVRINMKKKSFTRGKVSAEQKRKLRRKQNWRKRISERV